jgi:2-hydroxymuconate-semialdehyde hydrolase
MAEPTTSELRTGPYTTFLNRTGAGKDQAILFLHGSGPGAGGWANWRFTLPALGEQFDCLAPDLVGYNQSEHLEHSPDSIRGWLDVWMEQLDGLLDAVGHERVYLVGNSMGGALALHLVARRPERIAKLVLMGTVGVPFDLTEQLDGLWGFYDAPTLERMQQAMRWFVYDPQTVGGDLDAIAESRFAAATQPAIARSFAAMFPAPRQRHIDELALPAERIAAIEQETLLIHGRDDGIVPLQTSLYLLQQLQRPQLHVFGRCRHWVMIEHRHRFNQLLLDFFRS